MWYIYPMEYYSAIKKNKIMPFAGTWMELEILILGEVRRRDKILYIASGIKNGTNKPIYKTKTDS